MRTARSARLPGKVESRLRDAIGVDHELPTSWREAIDYLGRNGGDQRA